MTSQIIKNRLRKIFAYTFSGTIFLLLSSFLLLQIPPVQQSIINFYLRQITEVSGFQSKVKSMHLLWFDHLDLQGLEILDPQKNEMIAIEKLRVDFRLFEMITGNNVYIDGIALNGTRVFLKYIPETDTSENLNINILINRLSGSGGGGGKPPVINIGEAIVERAHFKYDDGNPDSLQGFDHHHFSLAIDEASLQKFYVLGDTIAFDVRSLMVEDEKTGLRIKDFQTHFRISQSAMEFYNLNLHVGNSYLADTVVFTYNSQADLSDFNNLVKIKAKLNQAVIDPKDIALFIEGAEKIPQTFTLSAFINGRVNDFTASDLNLAIGQSQYTGKLSMEGLPYFEETFIEARLNNSTINVNDIAFLLDENFFNRLKPLGQTRVNVEFIGYPTDFVANGKINTRLGEIRSDINLKINEKDKSRSTYSGNLSLQDFNLGLYLNDTTTFQTVSLNGNINGAGLTIQTADFKLKGDISKLSIFKYPYQKIKTNARFANEFFNGDISIQDPNLQASANGSIDFRNEKNLVQVIGTIDTANLHHLKLSKDILAIKTDVNINSTGLALDSLQGSGELSNLQLHYQNQWLQVDKVKVLADKTTNSHELKLTSDLVSAEVKGDFFYSDLLADVQEMVKEFRLNIINDKKQTFAYYSTNKNSGKNYKADFTMWLHNVKPLAAVLNEDFSISPNVKLEGNFSNGITTAFSAFAQIPQLRYQGFSFNNTTIDVNASKLADSTSVLAMIFIQSENQKIEGVKTKNLLTEAIWNNNHIDFSVEADQADSDNNVRLKGTVDFADSTRFTFAQSTIKILDKVWKVSPQAQVAQAGREWRIEKLGFSESLQKIEINGFVSDDPLKPLQITLQQLELASLNPLITEKLKGLVQAHVVLKDLYRETSIENDIQVKGLTVNNFLVGDITGKNEWSKEENKFLIDFLVTRKEVNAITLKGEYDPKNKFSPLEINASLNQANLKLAEPVLRGLFSQIDGTVTGDFLIKGTLQKPLIRGVGKINKGQIMIDYLKTLYTFDGNIGLTPTSIYFENIALEDNYKNKATLEGFIAHNNFNSMRINIDATFTNFMVLNTTLKDNTLFYGQGFASGKVNFFGPADNLKISATAKTERNSKLYIPIGSTSTVEKSEYINFVSFADTTRQTKTDTDNKKTLTGLTIDLNLDITPDAYCEIIFDIKAGDIIRGRGNGDLRLQLDTRGEFSMFGGVTFEEGAYNFTLYNVINKEFEIQKGSRITWAGDPYDGQLQIKAAYNQLASVAPIINNPDIQNDPILRRKYPMQVLLNLSGAMLSPDIAFDIIAKDLPPSININGTNVRLGFEFDAFKAKLDEQELNKQVFSLIILRRLSSLNDGITTSGSVANSVSELLSNQLSYWISQVDENLEIDVDLGALDQQAFNTFQLRLSYSFFNGRLRVTRDGTFVNQSNVTTTTPNTNSNTAALVGDWTVDYMLSADGKFKVRMYNRTNVNPIQTAINNQNTITTGFSLQHTQSFNVFTDLWRSARKRREKELAEERNKEGIIPKNDEVQ
ncbi:MAG: translocation/assembly module TamB domain-containing protein [Chryseotalea sp.]